MACLQVCILFLRIFPSLLPERCLEIESVITTQFIRSRQLGYNCVRPQKENIVPY
jgi:hypothetical protein